jgi:hypothetical protein
MRLPLRGAPGALLVVALLGAVASAFFINEIPEEVRACGGIE